MRVDFSLLDHKVFALLKEIGREADQRGLPAYVVGGFVRDAILKQENLDMDIVFEGDALDFAQAIAKKGHASFMSYPNFKTATLEYPFGLRIDVAIARKESYLKPGALPVVENGDIHDDLGRRDFTINALAASINSGRLGEILDFFGGLRDISKKRIRVLHDKSFEDDPTRILRAVRFEQRFSFRLERRTLKLLKRALRKNAVASVKPNRYFGEFRKILSEQNPRRYIYRLKRLGGMNFLHKFFTPNLRLLGRIEKNAKRLKTVRGYEDITWPWVYFLALTRGIKNRTIIHLANAFHLTADERQSLYQSLAIAGIKRRLKSPSLAPSQTYKLLKPLSKDVLALMRVTAFAKNTARHIDLFLRMTQQITLDINGEDLKKMGIVSGQAMGKLLDNLLYLKIDGKLKTREEQLQMVRRLKRS